MTLPANPALTAPTGLAASRPSASIVKPIEVIYAALVTLIVALLLFGVVSRYVFSNPVFGSMRSRRLRMRAIRLCNSSRREAGW